jgi:hypothetical protein
MNKASVVEVAPFVLADGVTEDQIRAAAEKVETGFLAGCDGYLGRILMRKDEENWMDIVYWRSRADVEKATEKFHDSSACATYLSCMKVDDDMEMPSHFDIVNTYGSLN